MLDISWQSRPWKTHTDHRSIWHRWHRIDTMIDENKTMIITTDRGMIAKRYTKYRGMINDR